MVEGVKTDTRPPRREGGAGGMGPRMDVLPKAVEEEFQRQLDVESEHIEKLKAQVTELQNKIGERSAGREEYFRRRDELKEKLDQCQKAIEKIDGDTKPILGQIESRNKESKDMKSHVQDMKKKLGFQSAEEVDEKIAQMEYELHTSTLTLKEEKKLISQISQMKNSKPLVGKYNQLASTAESFEDSSVGPLRVRLAQMKTELTSTHEQRKAASAALKALIDNRSAATAGLKELIEERDAIKAQLDEHFQKKRAITEERKVKVQEARKLNEEQRALKRQKELVERKKRQDEYERKKLARELENEDEEEEDPRIQLIENMIIYVKSMTDDHKEKPKIADTVNKISEADVKGQMPADATEVLLPKKDRELDFYVAPTAKKGKKKTGGGRADKPDKKKIVHDIGTISTFQDLKVTMPLVAEDCPESLKELNKMLEEMKAHQKKKNEGRDERKAKIQAKIDAMEKRIAAGQSAVAPPEDEEEDEGEKEVDAGED